MILSFVQRHAKFLILLWVAAFLLGAAGAWHLNDAVKAGGFNDQHGQSFAGQDVNRYAFGDPDNELSVVLTSDEAIDFSTIDAVEKSIHGLSHVERVTDGRHVEQLGSDTGKTQIVQVGFDADNTTTQNMVPTLRGKVAEAIEGTSVESHVTGAAALDYDLNIQSQKDALHAEMIAFPLLILVLLFIYRAVGPTLVTLVTAGICLAGTQGAGTVLAQFMDVSNMYITGASLIGLAVSVDYCLFLIARYKENIHAGMDKPDALRGGDPYRRTCHPLWRVKCHRRTMCPVYRPEHGLFFDCPGRDYRHDGCASCLVDPGAGHHYRAWRQILLRETAGIPEHTCHR